MQVEKSTTFATVMDIRPKSTHISDSLSPASATTCAVSAVPLPSLCSALRSPTEVLTLGNSRARTATRTHAKLKKEYCFLSTSASPALPTSCTAS
jgi:hypothetical protein